MRSIVPRDVNIVLQRLDPAETGEPFDLIIATNLLIYYGVFEQALALVNIGSMLRPGGIFLSNDLVADLPTPPMARMGEANVAYTAKGEGDRFVWYRR